MRPLPVLLTRPEAAARPLAIRLKELGARVVVSPLMRIAPTGTLPKISGGVLLTSQNAVSVFADLAGPRGLPAWVVGPQTARAAAAAGFTVRGMAPDVCTLVDVVPQDAPPLVHLRGEVTRGDLVARLQARGLKVQEAVIYRQTPLPLSQDACTLLRQGPTLVPLYSPRSATLLAEACPASAIAHLRLLALSEAVAAACTVAPLGISETPDGAGMWRMIGVHLNSKDG